MSKQIKLARVSTNLQILDKVKNTNTLNKYRVAYIDLLEAKAVLVSISRADSSLVIDLGHCDDFEIIHEIID